MQLATDVKSYPEKVALLAGGDVNISIIRYILNSSNRAMRTILVSEVDGSVTAFKSE